MNYIRIEYSTFSFARIAAITILVCCTFMVSAQPLLLWDKAYGGTGWENCNAAVQTGDLGYLLAGSTVTSPPSGNVDSTSRDDMSLPFWMPNNRGDFWILRTDENGDELWSTRFGGEREDVSWGVVETTDGGFLIGGESWSGMNGDKSETSRGHSDYWIVKTDALGNKEWDRTYGGDTIDQMNVVIQTLDGGYMIGGHSYSNGWTVADSTGEKSEPSRGGLDWWIVKTNAVGDIEWEKTYGGTLDERVTDIVQKDDGTYLVTGGSASPVSGEVDSVGRGSMDYWLLQLDANGNKLMEYRYGSDQYDEANKVIVSSDGNYVLAGSSFGAAASGDKTDPGFGDENDIDWWVLKIDPAGNILWQHTFGGSAIENVYSLSQNSVDHYLLGGFTFSTDGTLADNAINGLNDYWVMYLDPAGNLIWDEVYGGDQQETLEQIFQTNDGGYLMVGHSNSDVGGDKSDPGNGLNDFWIVKTLCNINVDLQDTIVCPGEQVLLSAYDPNCLDCVYNWSDNNNITDSIRIIIPQGQSMYGVTLTDGVGCQRSDTITIDTHVPPVVDLGPDQTLCPSTSTLLDAANVGLDIQWNTGADDSQLTVNYPGTYAVTVTDNIGCATPDSVNIGLSDLYAYVETTNTSCGENNGTATVIASGGTGAYTYTWVAGGNSNTITDLPRGKYAVVVNDGNCSYVASGIVGFAEPPVIEWSQNFGGSQTEIINDIQPTPDGGYIVVGSSTSADGDLTANFGGQDVWVKKLNASGMIEWQRDYGGSADDTGYSISLSNNGGYVIAATSASANGDIGSNAGGQDVWIFGIDATGTILWSQTFGGTGNDEGIVVKSTWDGGYVLAARTNSTDGDVPSALGGTDMWVIKLAINGMLEWQFVYGGADEDILSDIEQTADGGYIVGGFTASDLPLAYGGWDYALTKIDPRGNVEWQNNYGGSGDDELYDLLIDSDGGYLLAGRTGSDDIDVAGNNGGDDSWLLKVDDNGIIQWQSTLGGTGDELALSIDHVSDGTYLVLSTGNSAAGDFSGNYGLNDNYLLKVVAGGGVVWSQHFGSTQQELATKAFQTSDGAYLFAGNSNGVDTDLNTNYGQLDDWIVKLKPPLLPEVVLPADMDICAADTALIAPVINNCESCSWLWTDGSPDSSRLVQPQSTTTYEIEITDQFNCTSSDQITVNVNPLPVVNLPVTAQICENDSLHLNAGSDGVNYAWNTGDLMASIVVNTPGTYAVTVTDANACQTIDSAQLTINAAPIIELGSDTAFCEGNTFTLDVSTLGASYQWSSGAGNVPSILVNTTGNYSVTVTDFNSCSAEDEINITFSSLPQPVNLVPLNNGPYCPGEDLSITIQSTEPGVQYNLYDGNEIIGLPLIGTGADATINTGPLQSTTDLSVIASFAGACADTLSAVLFAEIDDIEAPVISCRNDTAFTIENGDCNPTLVLAAAASASDNCGLESLTYIFSGATNGSSAPTGINDASAESYNPGLTTVTYTAIDSFGNTADCSFTVEVIDMTSPLIGTAASDLTVECDGQGNVLAFNNWLATQGGATAFDDCSPLTWTTIPANPMLPDGCGETGSLEVTFVATDSSGNSIFTVGTFTIVDTQIPSFTVPADITIDASDDPLDLSITGDVIDEADNCDSGVSDQGPRVATFVDVLVASDCEDVINRTWTLTDECGNTNTQVQIITVAYPIPTVTITASNDLICEGDSTVLTFAFTGGSSFNVELNDGNQIIPLVSISDGFSLSLTPQTSTVYTINSIASTLRPACLGNAQNDLEINVYEVPEVTNVQATCDLLNTSYEVTFEIDGGLAGSYVVIGDAGSLSGNQFTSVAIPRDSVYTFFVYDANACDTLSITGTYDCACTTDAGYFDTAALTVCGTEVLTIPHLGDTLDNNDLLQFVLHDGDANNIGTIFLTTEVAEVSFQAGMQYGQTYYLTAIAGTDDGSGNVSALDDCYAVSIGIPIVFELPPTAAISAPEGDTLSCTDHSLHLSGGNSVAPGGLIFNWFGEAGGVIFGDTTLDLIEVGAIGVYNLEVVDAQTGCRDTTSIEIVADEATPVVQIAVPDPITCIDSIVTLNAENSSMGSAFDYQWSGGSILSGAQSPFPEVDAAGVYTLVITNNINGCVDSLNVQVAMDTLAPLVDAGTAFSLDCSTTEVVLSGSYVSPGNNNTIQWQTATGNIVSGSNTLTPTVDEDAFYSLVVTNLDNGCTAIDMVEVSVDTATPNGGSFEIIDPECFGEDNGSITILDIAGGTAPYAYSINGSWFTNNNEFGGLEEGAYLLSIEDSNGCQWDTLIDLNAPAELLVDLGNNQVIDLGDSIELNAVTNLVVDTFYWNDPQISTLRPFVQPQNETTYVVEVVADGCVESAAVTITVRKDRLVFIPSAFSPDGDGINDFFTIFADQSVVNIRTLQIFDRWGENVFTKNNFNPNAELEGWNGTFNGQVVPVGVFVYFAEIEFFDGRVEIFKGDVTVVR